MYYHNLYSASLLTSTQCEDRCRRTSVGAAARILAALGADDCSVSVWRTKIARPLIVAKEVFERQIMDLSW